MNKSKFKAIIFTIIALIVSNISIAGSVDMADKMRSDGKIYVVVAVLSVIFIGLVLYLFKIDNKVSKLEKELESRKNK